MVSLPPDFESGASANSTTPAKLRFILYNTLFEKARFIFILRYDSYLPPSAIHNKKPPQTITPRRLIVLKRFVLVKPEATSLKGSKMETSEFINELAVFIAVTGIAENASGNILFLGFFNLPPRIKK